MHLLRHSFLLPFFVHGILANFDTFGSLCPGEDGNRVSLSAGEYIVSCGGHFDWSVTGVRVDWQGAATPEECARLCSGSVDCDAMVFDGHACWEYSARGETLAPVSDPQSSTILLHPVIKIDPNDPNNRTPPSLPPLTPAQLQQQLDQCIQSKDQYQNSLYICEQGKQTLFNEREASRTEEQRMANERDACVSDRDQCKQERDQSNWKPQAAGLQCKRDDHTVINTGTKSFKLRCFSYKKASTPDWVKTAPKPSYADCMDACRVDPSCRGFHWGHHGKHCYLFPFVHDNDLVFNDSTSTWYWAGVTA